MYFNYLLLLYSWVQLRYTDKFRLGCLRNIQWKVQLYFYIAHNDHCLYPEYHWLTQSMLAPEFWGLLIKIASASHGLFLLSLYLMPIHSPPPCRLNPYPLSKMERFGRQPFFTSPPPHIWLIAWRGENEQKATKKTKSRNSGCQQQVGFCGQHMSKYLSVQILAWNKILIICYTKIKAHLGQTIREAMPKSFRAWPSNSSPLTVIPYCLFASFTTDKFQMWIQESPSFIHF